MFYLAGVMFAVAAFAAWAKGNVNRGYVLADQICGHGKMVCDNPKWLLVAAVVLGLVALYRVSVRQ